MIVVSSTLTANRANNQHGLPGSGGGIATIAPGSVATLKNTIVAGNRDDTGALPDDVLGDVDSASSFNLIGVDVGLTGISDGANGNQIGTAGMPLDPLLGFLQVTGGLTATHALLAGSPAIDTGDNSSCPATDQRGELRPADGEGDGLAICDIGAFELHPTALEFWIARGPQPRRTRSGFAAQ